MMQYTIVKSNSLDVNWQAIQALQINQFPWYSSGQKQATHIKLTYTDKELIISRGGLTSAVVPTEIRLKRLF